MKSLILLLCFAAVALSSCYAVAYYPDYYYEGYPRHATVYYGPAWDELVDLAVLGTLIWGASRADRFSFHYRWDGYRYRR